MTIVYVLIAVAVLAVMLLGLSVHVITQFERGVVFRFGSSPESADRDSP